MDGTSRRFDTPTRALNPGILGCREPEKSGVPRGGSRLPPCAGTGRTGQAHVSGKPGKQAAEGQHGGVLTFQFGTCTYIKEVFRG